jgi:hypothetical protein
MNDSFISFTSVLHPSNSDILACKQRQSPELILTHIGRLKPDVLSVDPRQILFHRFIHIAVRDKTPTGTIISDHFNSILVH